MSNQNRPFSWFRLAPFGRQLQPAPAPTPAPRPTAPRASAPRPFRPPPPSQPRPAIRPPAPAVTSPPTQPRPAIRPPASAVTSPPTQPQPIIRPPPPTVTSPPPPNVAPARALFPGISTTAAAAQPASRTPTTSSVPASPVNSLPATSIPASPITKPSSDSSPASPGFLPITSSFILRSPDTKILAPSSALTISPIAKPTISPPKSTAPAASTAAPTTATTVTATTLSPRTIKALKESPPKYPETKPLFRPSARGAPESVPMQQQKKLVLGQETAGNFTTGEKGKAVIDHNKHTKLPKRLVTLVGENKGAIMILNSSSKNTNNVFGGKPQTVGNKQEDHSSRKKESEETNTMEEMEESTLFINSNVQGVNNSILADSSLTHHNPGFHLFFSDD